MPTEIISWLPPGYRECEYIQSRTYQPINTGVLANDEFSMHMRMSLTEIPDVPEHTYYALAGLWDGTDAVWMRLHFLPGGVPAEANYRWTRKSNCAFSGDGDPARRSSSYYTVGKIIDIDWMNKLSERRITVDGVYQNNTEVLDEVPTAMPYPIFLFSANFKNLNGNGYPAKMRLYGSTLYDGTDTVIRNFVPAYRESDGMPGARMAHSWS